MSVPNVKANCGRNNNYCFNVIYERQIRPCEASASLVGSPSSPVIIIISRTVLVLVVVLVLVLVLVVVVVVVVVFIYIYIYIRIYT